MQPSTETLVPTTRFQYWSSWFVVHRFLTTSVFLGDERVFNVHGTVHRSCILKHDQQDATLYNTLYYCQRSTCFERCFRSSSGAQICTSSIRYLSKLLAVTASDNRKQAWQIPDAACTDMSSWWWAETPLETCRAFTIIMSIIQRCILLVMLKNGWECSSHHHDRLDATGIIFRNFCYSFFLLGGCDRGGGGLNLLHLPCA